MSLADPQLCKAMQVDKGAISHILKGANVMCQGLTSEGGRLVDAERNEIVLINAEGKEHALGIGLTMKSSAEIKEENADVALESLHCLNDDLWKLKSFKKK